jgi:hypothetical protein
MSLPEAKIEQINKLIDEVPKCFNFLSRTVHCSTPSVALMINAMAGGFPTYPNYFPATLPENTCKTWL